MIDFFQIKILLGVTVSP